MYGLLIEGIKLSLKNKVENSSKIDEQDVIY